MVQRCLSEEGILDHVGTNLAIVETMAEIEWVVLDTQLELEVSSHAVMGNIKKELPGKKSYKQLTGSRVCVQSTSSEVCSVLSGCPNAGCRSALGSLVRASIPGERDVVPESGLAVFEPMPIFLCLETEEWLELARLRALTKGNVHSVI